MKNWWIRFGCFLTGYDYEIVSNCSQATIKTVKQYLSAMLIIATFWGFVGYAFTRRYLHGEILPSLIGALIMIFIIIQIERIIVLADNKKKLWFWIFRGGLAILMAIIGSIIVDQMLFKDDIEIAKTKDESIYKKILPDRTREIDNQIQQIDKEISKKEKESNSLSRDIANRPNISFSTIVNRQEKDSIGHMQTVSKEVNTQSLPNPNIERLSQIEEQINKMREQKQEKENKKLTMQEDLEKEFRSKLGLLQELQYVTNIIFSSWVSKFIGFIFIAFFLIVELLVLVIKFATDNENDYNKMIVHQMETRIQRLKNLSDR